MFSSLLNTCLLKLEALAEFIKDKDLRHHTLKIVENAIPKTMFNKCISTEPAVMKLCSQYKVYNLPVICINEPPKISAMFPKRLGKKLELNPISKEIEASPNINDDNLSQIIEWVSLADKEISTLSMLAVNIENEIIETRNDQNQLFNKIDSMSTKLQDINYNYG
jgi:hypothetical protein